MPRTDPQQSTRTPARGRLVAAATIVAVVASLFTLGGAQVASASVNGGTNGIVYDWADEGVSLAVDSYNGSASDVVIADYVDVYGTSYPVTRINYAAFMDKNITSVSIPDTVTSISSWAFAFAPLTSVTFGNSLTYIGFSAFHGTSLTEVTFPASVNNISYKAFTDGLTSVTMLGSAPSVSQAGDWGSFAVGTGLTVYYPAQFASTYTAAGNGTWRGYTAVESASTSVSSESTASASVLPGVRSAILGNTAFDAITYSNSAQAKDATSTLSIDDATDSDAGWAVTVTSSNLVWAQSVGGPSAGADIPANKLSVLAVGDVATLAGAALPQGTQSSVGTLESPVTVLATVGGNGSYQVPLTFRLAVPAQSRVGTYTGTITTTIAVAP